MRTSDRRHPHLHVGFAHDALQNLELRLTPSAGAGYHAIEKKRISLDIEVAGGYQITRYLSVEPGARRTEGRFNSTP
jgi:hypothetical protein